jgi:hypothetical protein
LTIRAAHPGWTRLELDGSRLHKENAASSSTLVLASSSSLVTLDAQFAPIPESPWLVFLAMLIPFGLLAVSRHVNVLNR